MSHDSDIEKEDIIQWMEKLISQLKKPKTDLHSFEWIEGDEYELESGNFCTDYKIALKIVDLKEEARPL
jgi:hypothetical protein